MLLKFEDEPSQVPGKGLQTTEGLIWEAGIKTVTVGWRGYDERAAGHRKDPWDSQDPERG